MLRSILFWDWIAGEIIVLCTLSVPYLQQMLRDECAKQDREPKVSLTILFISSMVAALFWPLVVSGLTYEPLNRLFKLLGKDE